MRIIFTSSRGFSALFFFILFTGIIANYTALAQCSATSAPSYSSSCTAEYYTAVSASGTGITSTISAGFGSCGSTYYNYFATQGITAPSGATVNMSVTRVSSTYTAYLTAYVDWNNDGTYETTELAGSMYTFGSGATSTTYSFAIPTTGVTIGTNLHMRLMLSELSTGAPCSASYGQACDFYINVTCVGGTMTISPASASFCSGAGGVSLTASGAGTGGTYTWSPATGLSATTGATVSATPASTTTYTVTGTTTGGCVGTGSVAVTVNPLPTTTVTASGPLAFCSGGSVTLTATTGLGYSYQWYLAGTPITGATNISYTAAATGNYRVYVTNSFGCNAYSSVSVVTVHPLPTSIVTPAGATTVCGGGVVLNAPSTAGYSYQWLDGGTPITGATTVSYTATVTGTYSVQTTITATGCDSTTATPVSVVVNPVPAAVVTASGSLTFCAGDSVTLTASAGAGYTYQWYDGATIITGATSASYTTLAAGNYKVEVTNSFGCVATSAPSAVTVNALPLSGILASGSTTVCGGTVPLFTTVAAGYTYQWLDGGIPVPGATSSSYNAGISGNYTVFVHNTATGCSSTTSSPTVVTVNPLPSVTVSASGPLSFCAGNTVVLTASGGAGLSYQWYNVSTAIPGATGASYVAASTGSYMVMVTNSFGCTSTSAFSGVTVTPLPPATISYSGSSAFCTGGSKTLIASTDATTATVQWYSGGTPIGGAVDTSYTTYVPGTFSVVITNDSGCISTSAALDVTELATPAVVPMGDTDLCGGRSVLLTLSSAGGTSTLYQWRRNGVDIPGGISPSYSASTGGVYSCIEIVPGSCTFIVPGMTVTVYPVTVPVITFSGNALHASGGYSSYVWKLNGGLIAGATSSSYTPVLSGVYQVFVTTAQGCDTMSGPFFMHLLGVGNISNTSQIDIYPNPAGNEIHVTAPVPLKATISGMDGRVLLQSDTVQTIDISMLPAGLYLIELTDNDGNKEVRKLVKN